MKNNKKKVKKIQERQGVYRMELGCCKWNGVHWAKYCASCPTRSTPRQGNGSTHHWGVHLSKNLGPKDHLDPANLGRRGSTSLSPFHMPKVHITFNKLVFTSFIHKTTRRSSNQLWCAKILHRQRRGCKSWNSHLITFFSPSSSIIHPCFLLIPNQLSNPKQIS